MKTITIKKNSKMKTIKLNKNGKARQPRKTKLGKKAKAILIQDNLDNAHNLFREFY